MFVVNNGKMIQHPPLYLQRTVLTQQLTEYQLRPLQQFLRQLY